MKEEREAMDAANDAMAMRMKRIYQTTGLLTGLGSVIMMVAKSEEQMKWGMRLSTLGIIAMTAAQVHSTLEKMKAGEAIIDFLAWLSRQYAAMWMSIEAIETETIALVKNTAALAANKAAREGEAGAVADQQQAEIEGAMVANGLKKGGLQVLKRTVVTALALAAAYKLVNWGTKKWAEKMKDLEQDHKWTEAQAYSMDKFNETLKEHAGNYGNLAGKIQENKDAQERLHNNQTQFAKDRRTALEEELAILTDIQFMYESNLAVSEGTVSSFEAVAKEIFETKDAIEQAEAGMGFLSEAFDWTGIGTGYNLRESIEDAGGIGKKGWWESRGQRIEREMIHLNELSVEHAALFRFIEETGVTTWEGLAEEMVINAELWDEINNEVNEFVDNTGSNMVRNLREATDAMYEFNNTREEFFWGSTQPNMVGDLTRKVLQKGVENLITTTEVVMTNNFNGMTTEQAAEEILNAIERGAGRLGWDLTANA